jgi:hypothetical protein
MADAHRSHGHHLRFIIIFTVHQLEIEDVKLPASIIS